MKKIRLIKFSYLPAAWGLAGPIYEEAEARYYYDGEDLDRRLAEIKHKEDPVAMKVAMIEIDFKYGKKNAYDKDMAILEAQSIDTPLNKAEVDMRHGRLSKYEYEKLVAENNKDLNEVEKELELLRIEFENGKLTKMQYEKESFTLQEKPWVGVIDQGIDLDQGVNGFLIELDWNEYWIEFLRLNGYTGATDEQIIETWFSDVNNSLQSEETVAMLPLAARMRSNVRDNGTIY